MANLEINLTKLRVGKRLLIDNSFHISAQQGQISLIKGPNGVGKSVLFCCLAGWDSRFYDIEWIGDIDIEGGQYKIPSDVSKYNAYARKRMAFLSHQLFEESLGVTLEEELNFICVQYKSNMPPIVEGIIEEIGKANDAFARMGLMSSGQRQLIAILDVISNAQELDVVLFDEPTSYLSQGFFYYFEKLLDWIRETNPNCVILIATQDHRLRNKGYNEILFGGEAGDIKSSIDISSIGNSLLEYSPESIGISINGRPVIGKSILPFKFNYSIDCNSSIIIQGPNGGGKSTFLSCVGSLCRVLGRVRYWSKDVRKIRRKLLYPKLLGFQFQEPNAFEFRDTVEQILSPPPWKSKKEKESLSSFYSKIMELYSIAPQQNPRTLSSGQIKIIWLISQIGWAARWILDEPDASLDLLAMNLMKELIRMHCGLGGTFIAVTNDASMFQGIPFELIKFDGKMV